MALVRMVQAEQIIEDLCNLKLGTWKIIMPPKFIKDNMEFLLPISQYQQFD